MLIDLKHLIEKHSIDIKGILHIGAHHAEELGLYTSLGIKKVIWIEGNPEAFKILNARISEYEEHEAYNVLVSNNDGEVVDFNLATNTQSSSMLKFGSHKTSYPEIKNVKQVKLSTVTVDRLLEENGGFTQVNLVNLDIQGAELMALKGMKKTLKSIDYVYLEVNLLDVYKGCAKLHQIDYYLGRKGFIREELELTNAYWGDAFYIKSNPHLVKVLINTLVSLYKECLVNIQYLRGRFYKWRHNK